MHRSEGTPVSYRRGHTTAVVRDNCMRRSGIILLIRPRNNLSHSDRASPQWAVLLTVTRLVLFYYWEVRHDTKLPFIFRRTSA